MDKSGSEDGGVTIDDHDSRATAFGMPETIDGFAIFLDIDGTLLDIADTPEAIVVPVGLSASLSRLARHLEGAVALITGRSIATVVQLFPDVPVAINGLHGAEWRDASERSHGTAVTAGFTTAKRRLQQQVARWPGVIFEDKGAAFAAHYRLSPQSEAMVRSLMRALAADVGQGWKLQEGKAVVELRPQGRDKGDALMETMKQGAFAHRMPLAIGDDVTDEAMFAAANRLGGLSIRVGGDLTHSAAQGWLESPAAVRAWINRMTR